MFIVQVLYKADGWITDSEHKTEEDAIQAYNAIKMDEPMISCRLIRVVQHKWNNNADHR